MSGERCDVLIVGGGPAGASCARELRRAGLDVVIMDKKTFPRDKVCAGWVTPLVLDTLEIDRDDYAEGRVLQPISGFRSGMIRDGAVEVDYPGVVSYGIRRCEFDHYLLERSDARLLLGEPLKTMERHNGEWLINEHLRTPLVIGAGGHFCPVAKQLGARVGSGEPVVAAKEIEFEMTPAQRDNCRVNARRPELYFCNDLKGYGWIFRKGDYLNIGLGREDNHRLGDHIDAFMDWLKRSGRIPADIDHRFKGHAYLLYAHGDRPLIRDGVLLIGDAAGLAYPQSGEGIRPAIESAVIAARVLLEADGIYSAARLAPYRQRLEARFGPLETGERGLIPDGLRQRLAAPLLKNRWFTRHVVLDRWFLHVHQPPLRTAA